MERYRKEMNEIHAPRKLIDSTKKECHEAELSQTAESQNRKGKIGFLIPVIGAAVLFLAVMPAVVMNNASFEAGYDKTQLHMAQQPDGKEGDTNVSDADELIVSKTALIPMRFSGGETRKENIAGTEAYLTINEDGYYSACIPAGDEYLVLDSKLKEKEAFLEAVKKVITH